MDDLKISHMDKNIVRTVMPHMNVLEEMTEKRVGKCDSQSKVDYKVLEDKVGTLAIATMPIRIKYINGKTGTSGSTWNRGRNYAFMQYRRKLK